MGCTTANAIPPNKKYLQDDEPHHDDSIEHEVALDRMPYLEISNKACGYGFMPIPTDKAYEENSEPYFSTASTIPLASFNEILQTFEACREFFLEHDIDNAKTQATKLKQLCDEYSSKITSGDTINSMQQEQLQKFHNLIRTVNEEHADVLLYEAEIKTGGWVQKSNKNNIKVSSRKEGKTFGVLVEAVVSEPFENIISVLVEIDLYHKYTPWMKVSRQEKKVGRNCRVGYTENHIPFFSVRQAFFQGIAYNRLSTDGSLFLYTRSIHDKEHLQRQLDYKCVVNPNSVQLDYKYLVVKYEPLQPGKGKMTFAMNVDTKMDFIPDWIADKIATDFGNEFFNNIIGISKNFKGSIWETNVQKEPELFNFFKKVIDRYYVERCKDAASIQQK